MDEVDGPSLPEHIDEDLPPRTDESEKDQESVSQRLFSYLMDGADGDQRPNTGLNIFKLFKETLQVTQKWCGGEYISSEFLEQVELNLLWMVTQLNPLKSLDIGEHEYNVIIHALQQCKHESKRKFELTGTKCAKKAIVRKDGC
jgi:hypothetical protein